MDRDAERQPEQPRKARAPVSSGSLIASSAIASRKPEAASSMPRRPIATVPAAVDNTTAANVPAIGRTWRQPQASVIQQPDSASNTDGNRIAASFFIPKSDIAAAITQKYAGDFSG